MTYTVCTQDRRERGTFVRFLQAFDRVRELLDAGWRRVGIRNDQTQKYEAVCERPKSEVSP